MLALDIEFLTGRYVATAHDDRNQHEWPPHPARVFSALVHTWATDAEDEPDNDERSVLEWLEALPPPRIVASEATVRSAVTHFVPVNDIDLVGASFYTKRYRQLGEKLAAYEDAVDAAEGDLSARAVQRAESAVEHMLDVSKNVTDPGRTAMSTAVALLPERRSRQARHFPSVTPASPTVTYVWPEADPTPDQRRVLDQLLARVVRVGHSSSLVACRLLDEPKEPTWTPSSDGDQVLRGTGPGQLRALEAAFEHHRAQGPRSLPYLAVQYRSPDHDGEADSAPIPQSNLAGEWFVFETVRRQEQQERRSRGTASLPQARTVDVTRALRGTILNYVDDPLPELLSGHQADGTRTEHSHAAFLALPFVGHRHATGYILGCAIALPSTDGINDGDAAAAREALMKGIAKWESDRGEKPLELTMGRSGVLSLRRAVLPPDRATLRRGTWATPSQDWVTATPIALHRHPGDLGRGSAAARERAYEHACATVAEAFTHVGLPTPEDVVVDRAPFLTGAVHARRFPVFAQGKDHIQRLLVHARVRFAEPVEGPVMVGSGRYFGLGLMRPIGVA